MNRFFAVANGFEEKVVELPKRSTKNSAGYDFKTIEDVTIPSIWQSYPELIERVPEHSETVALDSVDSFVNFVTSALLVDMKVPEYFRMKRSESQTGFKPTLVETGIKAKMLDDEVLYLYNRSSNPKRGLILANGVGVIDSDYYGSAGNDGHIMFAFLNFGKEDICIKKGESIGQGVFSKYLKVDSDETTGERIGGFGSTNK